MKKIMLLIVVLCLLLAGCQKLPTETIAENEQPDTTKVEAEQTDAAQPEQDEILTVTVLPLPDTTMENLTDATLSVSFEQGDVYLDDTGKLQMKVKIYTYDLYDAVDISRLKVGDTIVRCGEEVKVDALERSESGLLCVNGGLENGGFELAAAGGGIFREVGIHDENNWYEAGTATIRVSADFVGYDNAAEVVIYPGDFLTNGVVNYNFTPNNTSIRVEAGQVVELNRSGVPAQTDDSQPEESVPEENVQDGQRFDPLGAHFAGQWVNELSSRCVLQIIGNGVEPFQIIVRWSTSAASFSQWEMTAVHEITETGSSRLVVQDCVRYDVTYLTDTAFQYEAVEVGAMQLDYSNNGNESILWVYDPDLASECTLVRESYQVLYPLESILEMENGTQSP